MRTVPTGRGQEIREVTDLHTCSGCGEPFELRRFTITWQQCGCTPGQHGHRIAVCLRGMCRAKTYDPPHVGEVQAPLEGHRTGPGWIQEGPTLDLGEG